MSKIIASLKKNFKESKLIVPPKNEIIVQHNYLIEARYRLSLQEKRVILWLVSQIQPNDDDLKVHTINIQEFCRIVGVESKNMYGEIQKVTLSLIRRALSIRNLEENSLTQVTWLSLAKYLYDEGKVELCFNPFMKPFLLNLKQHFTKITLSDVMQLHSIYAIRLYELLKQYESLKKRTISILDLREYCGVSENEYKNYNDFKRYVIEAALKEIDKKSDITFTYEELKQSRKIVSILFHISSNPNYKRRTEEPGEHKKRRQVELEIEERKHLMKKIMKYGFSNKNAYLMTQELDENEIKEALKAVNLQIETGKVRNTKAMLRTAFKEKWKTTVF